MLLSSSVCYATSACSLKHVVDSRNDPESFIEKALRRSLRGPVTTICASAANAGTLTKDAGAPTDVACSIRKIVACWDVCRELLKKAFAHLVPEVATVVTVPHTSIGLSGRQPRYSHSIHQ